MSLYNITEVILIVLCSIFILFGIKGIIQSNKYKKDTVTKEKIISYFKEKGKDGINPHDIPRDIMETGFITYMLEDQILKYEDGKFYLNNK